MEFEIATTGVSGHRVLETELVKAMAALGCHELRIAVDDGFAAPEHTRPLQLNIDAAGNATLAEWTPPPDDDEDRQGP